MHTIALQVFYGLLVELIVGVLTYRLKDRPGTAISILAVGTVTAAMVALYPFQPPSPTGNPDSPTSSPIEEAQQVTEAPTDTIADLGLRFKPCGIALACPESSQIFDVLGRPNPYDYNAEFPADVSQDTMIRFSIGWCTKEQQLLYDHLPHIQFVFAINGLSYQSMLDTQYDISPLAEDPNTDEYCYRAGVGASNWQPGVTYRITFGMILDTDLFDGWDNYTKGDYLRSYLLTGK